MTKRIYPSVLRSRRPEVVRICWIVETDAGSFHAGVTWGGLPSLTNRRGKVIKQLKIVDMKHNRVYGVVDYELFLQEWSDNYNDPKWNLRKCGGLKEL